MASQDVTVSMPSEEERDRMQRAREVALEQATAIALVRGAYREDGMERFTSEVLMYAEKYAEWLTTGVR